MRRDIPKNNQSAQLAHAAIEHAYQFGRSPDGHPSIVQLRINTKPELEQLKAALNADGIQTTHFEEPYNDMGLTAIACLLPESGRSRLSHLELWRP